MLPDSAVRLTNETRARGRMYVRTDKSDWRIEYSGDPMEAGHFRVSRRLLQAGKPAFKEWPGEFSGEPDGMAGVLAAIEAQDAGQEGGDPRTWQIHFDADRKTRRSSWTLPWRHSEEDLFRRLLTEIERREL
jgi:hypothetical protein